MRTFDAYIIHKIKPEKKEKNKTNSNQFSSKYFKGKYSILMDKKRCAKNLKFKLYSFEVVEYS